MLKLLIDGWRGEGVLASGTSGAMVLTAWTEQTNVWEAFQMLKDASLDAHRPGFVSRYRTAQASQKQDGTNFRDCQKSWLLPLSALPKHGGTAPEASVQSQTHCLEPFEWKNSCF